MHLLLLLQFGVCATENLKNINLHRVHVPTLPLMQAKLLFNLTEQKISNTSAIYISISIVAHHVQGVQRRLLYGLFHMRK